MDDVDPATQYGQRQMARAQGAVSPPLSRAARATHWCALLEGTDACFAPVLTIDEAAAHPHNAARGLFPRTASGAIDTQVAPRFLEL